MLFIDHIKDDWAIRFPCQVKYNRYVGASRISYILLCLMYFFVKTVLLIYLSVCIHILKFVFYDFWVLLRRHEHPEEEEDEEDDEYEEECVSDDVEELPFCQLFTVGEEMCLLIDRVEMCPDETAFIRVVDDEGYTPLYKRKIRRDKNNDRFIVFSGEQYYLNDDKTRPTVSGRK